MKNRIVLLIAFCLPGYLSFSQATPPKLTISQLTAGLFVYTTFKSYNGKPMSANSMYVVTDNGVVLFDTPWDTTQFQPLLDSIRFKHGKEVVLCIATHSHADRTGGFDFLKEKGVKTYTSKQTHEISKQNKGMLADFHFEKDTTFTVGQYSFSTYFGGEGHTKDNIVIWFGEQRVLYGGCLVKSVEAEDLGYTGEANLEEWPATIKKIKRKFSRPNYIITGHQDWSGTQSLNHTLTLLSQHRKKIKAGGRLKR